MKRTYFYTWLAALLLYLGSATAIELRDLYEAEVPVADQGTDARQQALRDGLAEVLVKITGFADVQQMPELSPLLDKAASYVQQYRYAAGAAGTAVLQMAFDSRMVNQALRQNELPVWGVERPLLLAWLALEQGGTRQLVSAAEGAEWIGLEQAAHRRGLPVRLPLLDLEDQAQITAADVWGGFHEIVQQASLRYRPQGILLGRLRQAGPGRWQGHWDLQVGAEKQSWSNEGDSADEVLRAGAEHSADVLVARFVQAQRSAVGGQASRVLELQIDDVGTLAAYARLLNYLTALNGVSGVQVTAAKAQTLRCRLDLKAEPETVLRSINLGSTLVAAPESSAYAQHAYRLLP